ncbi:MULTISPECIES: hypothetical protein [Thioalkalivibrio]|uniref:Uncharacterized protein n=1 Tax=Thioalkalivibrio halophilus TaxID=252474 RepID=A0A1V3A021_9GAMM|nr:MULTISPECIES: hypothetical protein [Thioalkalivibrio]OOC10707.1 hypothetical protein B1A74_04550 [Thioalkalivibrio halophilus]
MNHRYTRYTAITVAGAAALGLFITGAGSAVADTERSATPLETVGTPAKARDDEGDRRRIPDESCPA